MSKRKSSFALRLILGIVLAIFASLFIAPSVSSDVFYFVYFVLFVAFVAGTLLCCILANKTIKALSKFFEEIKEKNGKFSSLTSENSKIDKICVAYKESFLESGDDDYHKTRSNSDLYFGSETWMQDFNYLPIHSFLKIIPGTFIGFGILGTFIGFAGGLSSINISDSQSLLNGVQNLLDNLKYAFNTSIVGVLGSMFLNFFMIQPIFNRLDHTSKEFCDYLDSKFYVTEVDALSIIDENNRMIPFPVALNTILTKLEGVSSNINQMGLTIANQVGSEINKTVKDTLDKTIEQIIKAEIEKLKTEMNGSIKILEECQTHLQNAPQKLKDASNLMENSAKNSLEVFEKFNEEIQGIKNAISLMPDDFRNVNQSLNSTVDKLSENQKTLALALSDSTEAFSKTTEISDSLSRSYREQSEKIEQMISRFTDVLEEYRETSKASKELLQGYKGMDEEIAKIFGQINENTQNYGKIVAESLENYFKGFEEATKDISKQFADSTLALSEEVRRLNGATKA